MRSRRNANWQAQVALLLAVSHLLLAASFLPRQRQPTSMEQVAAAAKGLGLHFRCEAPEYGFKSQMLLSRFSMSDPRTQALMLGTADTEAWAGSVYVYEYDDSGVVSIFQPRPVAVCDRLQFFGDPELVEQLLAWKAH